MAKISDNDPVKLTLDLVGDTWSFQILRAAFYGAKRFDDFQDVTGASPNIVSARLKKLNEASLFEKVKYSDHAKRFEYRLTDKGIELYPIIVLMRQWGTKWLPEQTGEVAPLTHTTCGAQLSARVICAACNTDVHARAVSFSSK